MSSSLSRRTLVIIATAVAALVAVIGYLLMSIPPVVGLGDRVKLPLFHGGSTWVDLLLFTLMGVLGLVYLISRSDKVYAWEVGFRAIASPLWVINAVLGFIAASSTWDFSASKESWLTVVWQDPRLSAQVLLVFAVAVMIVLEWIVLDDRWHKALADVVFVVVMWIMLADVFLDPVKQSLHPDRPVLNSGLEIKLPFFGMVVAFFGISMLLSWVISSYVRPALVPVPAEDVLNSDAA
jgi:hypothetical protein